MTDRRREAPGAASVEELDVALEQPTFFVQVLRDLMGTLQDLVGVESASGFVDTAGREMGTRILELYKRALGVEGVPRERVGEVLCDLKRRVGGDFRVVEEGGQELVFENSRCPFGEAVVGRESLCMLTTNVFGLIAADACGYAHVDLERTIARGDGSCRVRVVLDEARGQDLPVDGRRTRDYFGELR